MGNDHFRLPSTSRKGRVQIGSLRRRVFETRAATRKERFACQDSDVFQICILIISNAEKIISNILYLHKSQKICIGIVFDFSWDIFMSQEKLQTMIMQKFWGVIEVYYGIVQVVNKCGCGNTS